MSDMIKLHERVATLETTQVAIKDSLEAQTKVLKEIRDELSLYKTIMKLVRAVGLTLAFILAFKFGDIKGLWK